MTESQKPQTTDALAAVPGLQLLGTDAEVGMCTGGYCVLPGQSLPDVPAKTSAQD